LAFHHSIDSVSEREREGEERGMERARREE